MPLLDQNGKPIEKEVMNKTYNSGFNIGGPYAFTYNPDEFGVDKYQEMYDYDDACQSAIDFMTLSVLSQIGDYSHPDEQISEFVNKEFETMKGTIFDMAENLCREGLKCGFSTGEMVLGFDGQAAHLTEVQHLNPAFITFDLHTEGLLKNRIKAVKQLGIQLGGIGTDVPPPIEKFIVFTYKGTYGNPYGTSALKSARPAHYFKKDALKSWAVALHKYGTPHKDVQVAKDAPETVDIGGEKVPVYDFLIDSLKSMAASTNLVLPEGVTANYDGNPGDIGAVFESAINWADKCIYRALLIPGLTASSNEDKGGSRALGDTHFKIFAMAAQRLRDQLVDCILDQVIRRLIIWNFGPQEEWGDFQKDELDPATAKIMSEIFASAVDKGIISMDRLNDMRYAREKIGAPEITDEEFAKEQADKQAKAEEMQKRLDQTRQAMGEKGQQPGQGPDKQQPPQEKQAQDDKQRYSFSRVNGIESWFVEA